MATSIKIDRQNASPAMMVGKMGKGHAMNHTHDAERAEKGRWRSRHAQKSILYSHAPRPRGASAQQRHGGGGGGGGTTCVRRRRRLRVVRVNLKRFAPFRGSAHELAVSTGGGSVTNVNTPAGERARSGRAPLHFSTFGAHDCLQILRPPHVNSRRTLTTAAARRVPLQR